MFISYFDESGDDGYPVYSSPLFVLSSLYMAETDWQENFSIVHTFRKALKSKYNFPVKQEFHTKEFVTDKSIYHGLYTHQQRHDILFDFCHCLSAMKIKCISVVIDKSKIRRPKYDVLEKALTYNVQRIENDLNRPGVDSRYIIITDEGRVSKMRSTTRAIQKINFIPSYLYPGSSYRREVKNLIEDPLPKDSSESYFIQMADLVSFVVSLYGKQNLCNPAISFSKRISAVLSSGDEIRLMDVLKPVFNNKASRSNPYGIVFYPK